MEHAAKIMSACVLVMLHDLKALLKSLLSKFGSLSHLRGLQWFFGESRQEVAKDAELDEPR